MLFIGPVPPPYGGVAVINEQVQGLVSEEWNIHRFDTSTKQDRERLYQGFGWRSFVRNIRLASRLLDVMQQVQPQVVNLFMSSDYSVMRDLLFLGISRLNGAKILIHYHSDMDVGMRLGRIVWAITAWCMRTFADKILVLSDIHASNYLPYLGKHKVRVFENFVDLTTTIEPCINLSSSLLFVGRLSREKGFFDLLDALTVLEEMELRPELHAIGVAQSDDDQLLIERILIERNMLERVHLLGKQSGSDKAHTFNHCGIFVFPSRKEKSSVVLKEATAAGMAIVASDLEENRIVLGSSSNHVFFRTGDSKDLANRLHNLLIDSQRIGKMQSASREVLVPNTNTARIQFLKILQEIKAA